MIQGSMPTIFLDISDFMQYAEGGNITVSGIQRVIANLVIYRTLSAYNVVPVMLERDAEKIYAVDMPLFQLLVEELLSGSSTGKYIQSLEKEVRQNMTPITTSVGDIFVMAGAFWIYDDYLFLKNLRECGVKIALFVHDLIPIRNPEYVDNGVTIKFEKSFLDVLSVVTLLLTNSDYVRDDVKDYIKTRLDIVIPVKSIKLPTELSNKNYTYEKIRPEIRKISLEPYALTVSTIEARKNHILLLKIWNKLRHNRKLQIPNLVFVGKWGWEIEELKKYIHECDGLDKWFYILNGVSDEELSYLYENCLITVYPSFAEGWGLPVGESLAHGKLCVASNTTSIPEVGGELVKYIDPYEFEKSYNLFNSLFKNINKIKNNNNYIKENFVPKTWRNYSKEFYECVDAHCKNDKISRNMNNIYSSGEIYFLGSNDVEEQCKKPDLLITARMTRVSGWHYLENWGCWASQSAAVLTLPTNLMPGTKISIYIKVQAPYTKEKMWLSCNAGGENFIYGYVSSISSFINFDGIVNEDKNIKIVLNSTGVHMPDGQFPILHIGVSALGFIEIGNSAQYIPFMNKILNVQSKNIDDHKSNVKSDGSEDLLFRILLGNAENTQLKMGFRGKILDKVSLSIARKFARRKKWEKAEKFYAYMLRRYINRPLILTQYGHILKEQGAYEAAAAAYRLVLKLEPENKDVRFHLSFIINKKNK
ncbi:glycosyltransferase family 1 protein [Komagataeibacter sp. FNDCR2]|uniref:glycosyltransferase family 4 protein n=1 Tax=Komagataeibacter sp. FNDCR2 TaxID=2878682 RepID=UPI001E33FCFF|nr:glycosyltransferase family 1 protein [Komagataeibacter sp. FNDCR2]MCE2576831.1 glycosyltransferase family 4 protein [Komagataeibacter sp. FNDCR2]